MLTTPRNCVIINEKFNTTLVIIKHSFFLMNLWFYNAFHILITVAIKMQFVISSTKKVPTCAIDIKLNNVAVSADRVYYSPAHNIGRIAIWVILATVQLTTKETSKMYLRIVKYRGIGTFFPLKNSFSL